jgi:hypothetical protein
MKTNPNMRGIKRGWYAMEHDGDLSSGLFPITRNASRESLSQRIDRRHIRPALRARREV